MKEEIKDEKVHLFYYKAFLYTVSVSRRGVSQDTPFFIFWYQAIMFTIVHILSKSQFDTSNRFKDHERTTFTNRRISPWCSKTEYLMTLYFHNMPPKGITRYKMCIFLIHINFAGKWYLQRYRLMMVTGEICPHCFYFWFNFR